MISKKKVMFLFMGIIALGTANAITGRGSGVSPYAITNYAQLDSLGKNLYSWSDTFLLANDIDATPSKTENLVGSVYQGFSPIGNDTKAFTGVFHGAGHVIRNLVINRAGSGSSIGLFGRIKRGAVVDSVGIENDSVSGSIWVGGLVGCNDSGFITASYSNGTTNGIASYSGAYGVGGLVGENRGGIITSSYSTGHVNGKSFISSYDFTKYRASGVGGLIGINTGSVNASYSNAMVTADSISDHVGGLVGDNSGLVTSSNASGTVVGGNTVGGLLGSNSGKVKKSFATGSVTASAGTVGGLIGDNADSVGICYSTGAVYSLATGSWNVGGLIGINHGVLNSSYATGSVTSGANSVGVGGLVGYADGLINTSYSTGLTLAPGSTYIGGLIGYENSGPVKSCFWDTLTSGLDKDGTYVYNTHGTSTASMMLQNTFSDWDFDSTWILNQGHTYPLLRSLLSALIVTTDNENVVYNGKAFSGGHVTYSPIGVADSLISGKIHFDGTSQGAVNVGTYSIIPDSIFISGSHLTSQQSYVLQFVPGSLQITPATVTVTALDTNAKPNEVDPVFAYKVSGLIGSDTLMGKLSRVPGDTVGVYAISLGSLSAGSNYRISFVSGALTISSSAGVIASIPTRKPSIHYVNGALLFSNLRGCVNIFSLQGDKLVSFNADGGGVYFVNLPEGVYVARGAGLSNRVFVGAR